MNLDDLIEMLQTLRARCPAAGTAFVHLRGRTLDEASYDRGKVQLGLFEEDEDDDDAPEQPIH